MVQSQPITVQITVTLSELVTPNRRQVVFPQTSQPFRGVTRKARRSTKLETISRNLPKDGLQRLTILLVQKPTYKRR